MLFCPKQQTLFSLILAIVSFPIISTNAFTAKSFFGGVGENSSFQKKKQATMISKTKTKVETVASSSSSSSSSFDKMRPPVSSLVPSSSSNNRSSSSRLLRQQQRRRRSSSSSSSSSSTFAAAKNNNNKAILQPLFDVIQLPQSTKNRIKVETIIDELSKKANKNKLTMKKPISSGCYRMVWSTVTSNSILGTILHNQPSNVLGGISWQIISQDKKIGENIVYWKNFDLRMVGLARLSPLSLLDTASSSSSDGYSLSISGLEFRYGANGCPEKEQEQQQQQAKTPFSFFFGRGRDNNNNNNNNKGNTLRLFYLDNEEITLRNGVGTLKLLYNDGYVRITKDEIQQNTYIHIKE